MRNNINLHRTSRQHVPQECHSSSKTDEENLLDQTVQTVADAAISRWSKKNREQLRTEKWNFVLNNNSYEVIDLDGTWAEYTNAYSKHVYQLEGFTYLLKGLISSITAITVNDNVYQINIEKEELLAEFLSTFNTITENNITISDLKELPKLAENYKNRLDKELKIFLSNNKDKYEALQNATSSLEGFSKKDKVILNLQENYFKISDFDQCLDYDVYELLNQLSILPEKYFNNIIPNKDKPTEPIGR